MQHANACTKLRCDCEEPIPGLLLLYDSTIPKLVFQTASVKCVSLSNASSIQDFSPESSAKVRNLFVKEKKDD